MQKFDIKKLSPKDISFKNIKPKKKLGKKAKIIVSVLVIIVLGFALIKVMIPHKVPEVDCATLSKGSIVNKINILGEVKSENSTNVYSTLSNVVKEVNVKVGDIVKAGDVLAILDSGSLEKDIEQAIATTNASEANAKIQYNNAKKTYDDALYLNNNSLNSEITNSEAAVNSTKLNLEDKKKVYEYNKALLEYGEISEQELNQYKMAYENATDDYNKAVVALENAKIKVDSDLNNAKNNYETAKINYENKSQRIGLEKQQQQLEECTIKSPSDGTITSVNVVVGSPSTGTLFEIEDLKNITVTATIKEVDVANVKVGQKAEIKTDATGDVTINGEVISINPTANKNNSIQGQAQSQSSSTNVNFDGKIKINDLNEEVKVGMQARINIILDEKSDVYTVSYESIVQDGDNNSIYVAEKIDDKENQYIVKEIPVNVGLESDVAVEILGEGITDDILVINDPSKYKVGQTIEINGR